MTKSNGQSETLERLKDHRKRAEDNQKNPANEGQTRQYLIDPFIRDVLGYDRDDHNDLKEAAAVGQGDNGKKEVDYAIKRRINGKPEHYILVEAKTVGHNLGEKELDQLKEYVAREEFSKFGVLTNGIEYKWYRCPPKKTILEDIPFLTHSALEAPATATCEWLTAVRRDATDRDDLERLAWRLSLENEIRAWLFSAFEAPVDPAVINKAVGLKVPTKDHAIVSDAARAVWASLQIECPPPPTPPPISSDIHLEIAQEPQLVLGDGEVLTPGKLPRAWRIGTGQWRKTDDASELVATVLSELLRCDTRRNDEKRLARELNLESFDPPPSERGYRKIDGFRSVYCNTGVSNSEKRRLLERIAKEVEVDASVGHQITLGKTVECWLPTGGSRSKRKTA